MGSTKGVVQQLSPEKDEEACMLVMRLVTGPDLQMTLNVTIELELELELLDIIVNAGPDASLIRPALFKSALSSRLSNIELQGYFGKNGNAAVGYGRESLLELRKRKREQQGPASSGVRRGVAAVAGDSWTRGGCSRCGCGRGKKMRRVRLEVTAAAREDGYNLQSHDREEEWATMTQLRAGRQHQRGRRQ
ncbi:hypothetical protein GW17_00046039 [Ensete ventricosum]|nr:hypothetical protein GW17_00046039 [Ensete ventricosum]